MDECLYCYADKTEEFATFAKYFLAMGLAETYIAYLIDK